MSEHTKEPWQVRHDFNYYAIAISRIDGDDAHAATFPVSWNKAEDCSEADARRIVACVNALKGVPTAEVERWGEQQFQISTRDHYDGLKAINAELLEALQSLVDEQNGPPLIRNQDAWFAAMAKAAAALIKAEPS